MAFVFLSFKYGVSIEVVVAVAVVVLFYYGLPFCSFFILWHFVIYNIWFLNTEKRQMGYKLIITLS